METFLPLRTALQKPPPAVSSFTVEETSFPLSPVNPSASDGELRCMNHPSSSSKPRARHSLLKELKFGNSHRIDTKENKTL
jgi:hypothetical protein